MGLYRLQISQHQFQKDVTHQLSRFLVNRRDDEADLSDLVHIFQNACVALGVKTGRWVLSSPLYVGFWVCEHRLSGRYSQCLYLMTQLAPSYHLHFYQQRMGGPRMK